MQTWIALLRGINVGGKNLLPMAQLKTDLESLSLKNLQTYIQSGNVVFQSAAKNSKTLAKKIATCIAERHGFSPTVIVISREEWEQAIAHNPFADTTGDPKSLHFFFLAAPAKSPDLSKLDGLKSPTEDYRLRDRLFYLRAPDGIGRSKLAAGVEKQLGVAVTARNYRTVEKLAAMAKGE